MSLGPGRVLSAIETYETENAGRYDGEDRETVLYDMVTDLLLFAMAEGYDVDAILHEAESSYVAEKDEV